MGQKKQFTPAECQEIMDAMKGSHPGHVYKRLLALKLRAVDQYSNEKAGQIANMHATTVSRVVSRYQLEGIQAIIGKRHNHGKRYMTNEQEVEFLSQFIHTADAGQVIEVQQIHKTYEKVIGHQVARGTIYYILHKHGWRKVMPRSKHPKKASEETIQA